MWKTLIIPLMLFASITFSRGQVTDAPDDGMSTTPVAFTGTTTAIERRKFFDMLVTIGITYRPELQQPNSPVRIAFISDLTAQILREFTTPDNIQVFIINIRPGSVIVDYIIQVTGPAVDTVTADTVKAATRSAMGNLNYTVLSLTATERTVTYTPLPTTVADKTIPRSEVTFRVVLTETYLADYNTPTSPAYIAKVADLTKRLVLAYQAAESITSLKLLALRITRLFSGSLGIEYIGEFSRGATLTPLADFGTLTKTALTRAGINANSVAATGITWLPQSSGMGGLSPGVIAAIVIACVIVVVLIIILVIYLVKRPSRVACGS